MKQIGIVGAGGFAREVLWLLTDLGLAERVASFYESDSVWKAREVAGRPVLPLSRFEAARSEAVLAIGSPAGRRQLIEQLPGDTIFPTLIHPSVMRSTHVEIGQGTVICAGCVLTWDIRLGIHNQLNLHTTVGHDCVFEDFVTTAPAVNISGACHLGTEVYVGTNACVREGLTVAGGTVIGMGAVVVSNIAERGTYVGNPARRAGAR